MSRITTHVLDTALGRPAAGVRVELSVRTPGGAGDHWTAIGAGVTDPDGRARDLLGGGAGLETREYRLRFFTGAYHASQRAAPAPPPGAAPAFYPHIDIVFSIADASQHHHIPLLLSPYGYSTYRGS